MRPLIHSNSTESEPHAKQRVALLVEYVGKGLAGSQYQSHHGKVLATVQSELETALSRLNLTHGAVHFSGRTDAGVNARGQVAHVDLYGEDPLKNIPRLASALNATLSDGVSVKEVVEDVDPTFHSQLNATHRWYRYTILNRPERSALAPLDSLWLCSPLDVELMHQASQQLVEVSDFSACMASDSQIEDTICRIDHVSVKKNGDFVIFDIVANRFLYKMVRSLMGLLVSIGKHERAFSPTVVPDAIAHERRDRASWYTLRPDGLSLMAVGYPQRFDYFVSDEHVQTLKQLLKMESMQDENLFRKAS
jgi:tRNA pseudouridine38-40 synthase